MNIDLLLNWVLTTSAMGSLLSAIIILIKWIFKNKLSANWHYYIWILLILRLVIPFGPESIYSINNIFNAPITKNVVDSVNNKISPTINQDLINESTNKGNTNINIDNNISSTANKQEKNINNSDINNDKTNRLGNNKIDSVSSTSKGTNRLSFLSLIWLIGAFLMILYILAVNIKFSLSIRKLPTVDENEIIDILNKCKSEMGINSKVSLINTAFVKTPSLYGLINPRILLPQEVINKLSLDEKRYVILHELAHLKRKDIFMNCITIIIQILHWFNPFIWYAFYKMRLDSEVACDAYVLSKIEPKEHKRYGETLLNVLQAISRHYWAAGTTGMTNSKSGIKTRISMIAKFKKKPIFWTIVAVILILILGIVGLTNSITKSKITPKTTEAKHPSQDKTGEPEKSLIYTNEKYGFSLTFPMAWKDYSLYEYPEPFKYAEASYSFNLPSKEKGWEKTKVQAIILAIYTPENYQKLKKISNQPDYSSSVIYQGKYVYVYTECPQSPNDVRDRLNEVPSILKTFKIIDK